MPFAAGLSVRPAAAAGRARSDGKSVRGLERTDPGCDVAGRSACRARRVAGVAAQHLRDARRAAGQAAGVRTARGRQRTDARQVLGALRPVHRRERVVETRRAVLPAVAAAVPDWVRDHAPPA